MTTKADGRVASDLCDLLGPVPARWYVLDRDGLATLCKDAERYRWLRGNLTRLVCDAPGSESPRKVREVWVQELHAPTDAATVDAAIDAEMAIVPAVGAA